MNVILAQNGFGSRDKDGMIMFPSSGVFSDFGGIGVSMFFVTYVQFFSPFSQFLFLSFLYYSSFDGASPCSPPYFMIASVKLVDSYDLYLSPST